jgi:hypothetical protein
VSYGRLFSHPHTGDVTVALAEHKHSRALAQNYAKADPDKSMQHTIMIIIK